jgi:hypothetical protein
MPQDGRNEVRALLLVLTAAVALGCSAKNTAGAQGSGGTGGGMGRATGSSTNQESGGASGAGSTEATGGAGRGGAGGLSTGGAAGRASGGEAGSVTGGTLGGASGGVGGLVTGGHLGGMAGGTGGTASGATGGIAGSTGGATGTGGASASPGRDASADASQSGGNNADANRGADTDTDGRVIDAASIPGTNNPVLPGLNADPQVALFDGTFYIYPTTDGFASWGSTSFSVFSSTDLVRWTDRGVILDIPTGLNWATGHGWAPGIARVGATYYFYFSADSQLGVATGSSPTGPFKDALGKPLATTRQYGPQSIDPYAFIDDDGTPYLYFGSGSGGLLVAKLNANMISFSGTPTNISPSGASGTLEGSAMFKRNGTYYLAWSEGDTRNATYQMAYASAKSPLGPFSRLGVILQQNTTLGILGPGGGTVLALPSHDAYYLVYHRFKIPGGDGTHRETCIDRMTFDNNGAIISVKPTLEGLQMAVQP